MRLTIDPAVCIFATDIRVRWADTDAMGVAYNGSFFTYFEVARVEYHRALLAFRRGISIDDPSVQEVAVTMGTFVPIPVDDDTRLAIPRFEAALAAGTAPRVGT